MCDTPTPGQPAGADKTARSLAVIYLATVRREYVHIHAAGCADIERGRGAPMGSYQGESVTKALMTVDDAVDMAVADLNADFDDEPFGPHDIKVFPCAERSA